MRLYTHIAFYVLMLALCLPLAYQFTQFTWGPNLHGYIAPPEKVELHDSTWLNGRFQENLELQARHHLRLKHPLIRINNQLAFGLFGQLRSESTMEGKEGYLFDIHSIETYQGKASLDAKTIRERVQMLARGVDSLAAHGAEFLFVLAPDKASYVPEMLPAPFDTLIPVMNNAQAYRAALAETAIPVLDAGLLFQIMKDSSRYPLYSKNGFHWSEYSAFLIQDTLLKRVSEMINISFPAYRYGELKITSRPSKLDNDLTAANNLLWSLPKGERLAYPSIEMLPDKPGVRPKAGVIADSYYWNMHLIRTSHNFFDEDFIFWYYYREPYISDESLGAMAEGEPDKKAFFSSRDIIIFMITERNLDACCWGISGDIEKWFDIK